MKIMSREEKNVFGRSFLILIILSIFSVSAFTLDYKIVDTAQSKYFDNSNEITEPTQSDAYYGQDAQIDGYQPSYTDNGDGTVTDNVTGLMWVKTCDLNDDGAIDIDDKMSYEEALSSASDVTTGGYNDWRIPTIKEQYSLIIFSGIDPSGYDGDVDGLIPFIDTDFFGFGYGDEDAGERIIDAQMVTSTIYVATTMEDAETMFGVNFADGRIKGYGTGPMPGQSEDKQFYVYYVRGNANYGTNDFQDNADETISDNASGLIWSQNDSGDGMNWEDALAWVQQKNTESYLGYSDWRLPNVKELHSIVDYTRCPDTTDSAAIDAVFNCTEFTNAGGEADYPFYWSSTTHENWSDTNGGFASYVSFGRALGWMENPPNSGNYTLMDVHGAGAQRSDPKDGDPEDYPNGNGPQGDVVRIFNHVRLVRDFDVEVGVTDENVEESTLNNIILNNYPNPFNPTTTISYQLSSSSDGDVEIIIYNSKGKKIRQFSNLGNQGSVVWNGKDASEQLVGSGIYFYQIKSAENSSSRKMLLLK